MLQARVATMSTHSISKSRHCQRGYVLITLLLFVALLAIAAGVMAPILAFQVKRDREEELIHRGVQYSRAMKHFVKKFGRYPTRIEELEKTNEVRFLRRRYKDPITGKDFKILRVGDVQMAFAGGIAGATPVSALSPGAPGGVGGLPGQLGGPNGAPNIGAISGGLAGGPGGPTGGGVTPGPKGTGTPQDQGEDAGDQTPQAGSASSPSGTIGAGPSAPGAPGAPGAGGAAGQPQVFGGGPMVGVASTSRDKSIRVFNKKDHYYQWQFIYDPSTDRGGLLTTPNQPALAGTGTSNAVQTGAPGTPGVPGTLGGQGSAPTQPGPGTGQPPGITPQMPPDQTEQ